jgi:hypothetical protein
LVSSIGITWLGWMIGIETGNYTPMCLALGGLALSRWLHVHGHAHWHFRECEESLQVTEASGLLARPEREQILVGEIAALFARLEAEGDVWTRGEIRREIAARLAAAPALRAEFAEALAAHPEL